MRKRTHCGSHQVTSDDMELVKAYMQVPHESTILSPARTGYSASSELSNKKRAMQSTWAYCVATSISTDYRNRLHCIAFQEEGHM